MSLLPHPFEVNLGHCPAVSLGELFFLREKKMHGNCLRRSFTARFHLQGLPSGWAYKEATVVFLEGKGEAWQSWTRVRGEEETPGGIALGEVEPHLKSRGGRGGLPGNGKRRGLLVLGKREDVGLTSVLLPGLTYPR